MIKKILNTLGEFFKWLLSNNKKISQKTFFWIFWGIYLVTSLLFGFAIATSGDSQVDGVIVLTIYLTLLGLWTWLRLNDEFGKNFMATSFLFALITTFFYQPLFGWTSFLLIFLFVMFNNMISDKKVPVVETEPVKMSYWYFVASFVVCVLMLVISIVGLFKASTLLGFGVSIVFLGSSVIGLYILNRSLKDVEKV